MAKQPETSNLRVILARNQLYSSKWDGWRLSFVLNLLAASVSARSIDSKVRCIIVLYISIKETITAENAKLGALTVQAGAWPKIKNQFWSYGCSRSVCTGIFAI